jgi:hypothetical protein
MALPSVDRKRRPAWPQALEGGQEAELALGVTAQAWTCRLLTRLTVGARDSAVAVSFLDGRPLLLF